MTARDFVRFGLLYLRGGMWDGRRPFDYGAFRWVSPQPQWVGSGRVGGEILSGHLPG